MKLARNMAIAAAALVVLVVGGGYGALRVFVSRDHAESVQALHRAFASHQAQVLADHDALAGPLLASRRDGEDAGAFLNPRVKWTGNDAAVARWRAGLPVGTPSLALAPARRRAVQEKDWLDAKAEAFEGLDFSWMEHLDRFAYWDLDHDAPPAGASPTPQERLAGPIPDFIDLRAWTRLRLLAALRTGDLVPCAGQVRELARLCFSTETLLGVMVGVAMLGVEDEVRERAEKDGRPFPDWKTVGKEERDRMRRAAWAATAYPQLDAPAVEAESFSRLTIGRCAALNEGLWFALLLRPGLQGSRGDDYARLDKQLREATDCRLVSLRKAWNAPSGPLDARALCSVGGTGAWADACPAVIGWLPGAKGLAAEVALMELTPSPFRDYEAPPASLVR